MADGAGSRLEIDVLTDRMTEVWDRIKAAGGTTDSVTLIGVTKTFPIGYIESAVAAGLVDLGENYAQELVAKDDQTAAAGFRPRWHFIGGLQRNKVKLLAGRVELWHTVDRLSLLDEIAKRDSGARVLIQVNTTGEAQKSGCEPQETASLVDHGRSVGLTVEGLMTVGPTGDADPRPGFDLLRHHAEQCDVPQLSMGMSADFELAVAAGSTMVRIGSALFGSRTPRV